MDYMICMPPKENCTRESCQKVHNILARMSDRYKLRIVPEPVKNKQFPCPDFYKKYRIYKQVKERYDEMSAQIDDLTKSKSELTSVIHRLENEMRGQFLSAFNEINDNFAKVFVELFGGGSAELVLTEPEDVLSSGIEIKAAPPGKIIKSLTLLSGGEQAFVAIALFFAILKVNPSPFCILDEIEAALDEVNVSRFADYVKRMSGETQFVLITHRRGTMEAADRIYGVTMPERGISKVLALNVNDMEIKI